MRLGSYYRKSTFQKLFSHVRGRKIMDFGGYDGYALQNLSFTKKVVVDLHIDAKYKDVTYIQGTIRNIPTNEKYDAILLFDVIQYIHDPKQLFRILAKHLQKNGCIYLSVPHPLMKVFPVFISNWLHKKWGNYVNIGYTVDEIRKFLPKDLVIYEQHVVNERYFRLFYFPLRFIWGCYQALGQKIIRFILAIEKNSFYGDAGHIYIALRKGKK